MAWQGAVLKKDHGGPDTCPRCGGEANTLGHAILECPAWDSFDLGVDEGCVGVLPKQEDCFILRGLVPMHWTYHPPLPAESLQPVATGLFLENLPDVTGLYVATQGKDVRWRVVAWAVVIAQAPNGPFPIDSTLHIPDLEVVGTLKGVMQVGSSVAEGESQALCEAARRHTQVLYHTDDFGVLRLEQSLESFGSRSVRADEGRLVPAHKELGIAQLLFEQCVESVDSCGSLLRELALCITRNVVEPYTDCISALTGVSTTAAVI